MNSVEHALHMSPSLSGSNATVTSTSRALFKCHSNGITRLWPTISAANLYIFTLSARFADACDIAQLVVQITETVDDEFRIRGSAISRKVTGLTIRAANLEIITLSACFADACYIARLVIQIMEPSDDA